MNRFPFGRRLVGVLIAAALLYLVGNGRVNLWDRDEPRYAQTSKQMLASDPPDWVVPRLLDNVRTAKPIFIYWCQAASMAVLGATDYAARLPSAVAMLITLLVLGVALARGVGPRRALWTVLVLASSALVIAAAKMCITDSVLLLWILSAQLCLYAIYRGNRSWGVTVLLWVMIGLAGLTKGPVVLAVQLTTMVVLALLDVGSRWRCGRAWIEAIAWWRHTRPLVGLLILAAVVGPWLVMLQSREPSFLRQTILHDVVGRARRPLEGHRGPPGYYLLTVWATYMPWSILLPLSIVLGWQHRRLSPLRFALASVIGPWILVEMVQTKLVHYLLPAFPGLAFLTADALVRCMRGQCRELHRTTFVISIGIWAVIVAVIGLVPWVGLWVYPAMPASLYVGAAAITLAGFAYAAAVFLSFRARRIAAGGAAMAFGMMLVISLFYGLYLPNALFLQLPRRVAESLVQRGATTKGDVVMIDFQEDSLPYYQGGTIRPRGEDLFDEPPDRWPTWIVLSSKLWDSLPPKTTARLEVVDRQAGWAYAARGKRLEVLVARRRGDEGPAAGATTTPAPQR